jgi:hypothetical protein
MNFASAGAFLSLRLPYILGSFKPRDSSNLLYTRLSGLFKKALFEMIPFCLVTLLKLLLLTIQNLDYPQQNTSSRHRDVVRTNKRTKHVVQKDLALCSLFLGLSLCIGRRSWAPEPQHSTFG